MCDCTRRAFVKAGGLSLFALGLGGSPLFLGRTAWAAAKPASLGRHRPRQVLVAIFQRGAMDGLAALTPFDEPALRRLRPRLAMSAARRTGGGGGGGGGTLLDLDGRFGLHPGFAPLVPLWRDGRLAAVHAVGSPDPTRSHFDAQDYMETGTPGRKGTSSGWLNRVSGLLGHEATPWRAVSMTAALPRSLAGNQPAIAVTDLADFALRLPAASRPGGAGGDAGTDPRRSVEARFEEDSQRVLRSTANETFEAIEMLSAREAGELPAGPGAAYPPGPLGTALRQIAQLIKGDVGLEVAFAESGGWDTHVRQGAADGTFARRAADLAQSIAAFWTDLGTRQDDVVLMTMTEFGRTAAENGSGGTDHGHGSCLFVLGNRVDGGRVHGRFPGLDPDALHEGRDLPVTTDFRAVFAGVAGAHLGIADDEAMFPGMDRRTDAAGEADLASLGSLRPLPARRGRARKVARRSLLEELAATCMGLTLR